MSRVYRPTLRSLLAVAAGTVLVILVAIARLIAGPPGAAGSPNIAGCHPSPRIGPSGQATRRMLGALKAINYYPADAAQTQMWSHWQPGSIDHDLSRIAGLHANAVRIVLFPSFGYPHPPGWEERELRQFVRMAGSHGLRVQLTLFGFWQSYADLSGSREWAQAILAPYRNSRQVAFVEIQNEIDTTNRAALGWAQRIAPCLRTDLGSVPLSLSVSGTQGLAGLTRLRDARIPIDLYSLHYYDPPTLAFRTFQAAEQIAGKTPLFIGETGYSTDPAGRHTLFPNDDRWWEAYQDQYLRTVAYAALALHLPLPEPWVFSDLDPRAFLPASSAGMNPAEYHYGLVRANGSPKPVAMSVQRLFAQRTVSLQFNNGFEDAGTTGLPLNWLIWQPQNARFTRDTHVSHSGHASAAISQSYATSAGYPAFYLSPIQFIEPGHSYSASVWVRGQDATGTTHLALSWFNASNQFLSTSSSYDMPEGTTGWRRLELTAVAPPQAASVQLHLVSANNSGTAWFDDVAFAPVG